MIRANTISFVANVLTPRGFTTDQFEEIIADSLRLEKIKTLLGATNAPAPSEIRAAYEQRNQKTEASVIRLKLEDFKKDVKVSDEDVQKRFEEQKAVLQHPEKAEGEIRRLHAAGRRNTAAGRQGACRRHCKSSRIRRANSPSR